MESVGNTFISNFILGNTAEGRGVIAAGMDMTASIIPPVQYCTSARCSRLPAGMCVRRTKAGIHVRKVAFLIHAPVCDLFG